MSDIPDHIDPFLPNYNGYEEHRNALKRLEQAKPNQMSIPNILPNPNTSNDTFWFPSRNQKATTNPNAEIIGEKFAEAVASKIPDIGVRTCPRTPHVSPPIAEPVAAFLAERVAATIPDIGVVSCITRNQKRPEPTRSGPSKWFPIRSLGNMATQPAYVQDLSLLMPNAPSTHRNPIVRFTVNKLNSVSADLRIAANQARRKLTAGWKAGVNAAKKA